MLLLSKYVITISNQVGKVGISAKVDFEKNGAVKSEMDRLTRRELNS